MNLAKISPSGQVTVPVEIRRVLGLRIGDKVLFAENDRGEIVIANASVHAIRRAQQAFEGVAEDLNLQSVEDAQDYLDNLRYGPKLIK